MKFNINSIKFYIKVNLLLTIYLRYSFIKKKFLYKYKYIYIYLHLTLLLVIPNPFSFLKYQKKNFLIIKFLN